MFPLFDDFPMSNDDKALLSNLDFVRKVYHPHTDIMKEGDHDDRVMIVGSGWTALYRIDAAGERQIVDFPAPGDVVGLDSFGNFSHLSYMAVTDAVIYETSIVDLCRMLMHSASVARFFLDEVARQRAILVEHMIDLSRRSALARTAHLLLELGARRNMGFAERGYDCPLTQSDLGDALGLTAIHVNRMLRELRQADMLHFHKGFVGLLNEAQLKAISGFDRSYFARIDATRYASSAKR